MKCLICYMNDKKKSMTSSSLILTLGPCIGFLSVGPVRELRHFGNKLLVNHNFRGIPRFNSLMRLWNNHSIAIIYS